MFSFAGPLLECDTEMKTQENKGAGVKQIAGALGISIGTVDRALHDRPGVNPATRANVLAMAEKLNYKPNIAARNLKLNRHLRIGVYLPKQIASFFDPLRAGVRAAAGAVQGVHVEVEFHDYLRSGKGDLESLQADVRRRYDGVLLTPGPGRMEPLLRYLHDHGTSVVCVASDAPSSERLTAVSVDGRVSGGIAAELLTIALPQESLVAVFTGSLETNDHADKVRGFAAALATLAPQLTLLPAVESHENPEEAYKAAIKLLGRRPRPSGIYVNTANSIPVLRALSELGLLGQVKLVTTDIFKELLPMLESGKVLASLYQRPFAQGRTALDALLQYLINGVRPPEHTQLAPHIILRSNLSMFVKTPHGIEMTEPLGL